MADTDDYELSSNVPPPGETPAVTPASTEPSSTPIPEPAVAVAAVDPAAEPVDAASPDDERDAKGRFKGRHRTQRNQAKPDDVPRINDLTLRLRATETELQALKAAQKPAEPAAPVIPAAPVPAQAATFADPEPALDAVLAKGGTYEDWIKDWNRWDRKKDAFDQSEQQRQAAFTQQQQQASWTWQEIARSHEGRMQAYIATHPTFLETLAKAEGHIVTPLLQTAMMTDPNGPSTMEALSAHPEIIDELFLTTEGKPLTPQNVAITHRLLTARLSRLQAAPTGSAAVAPAPTPAPRPPNPVRTGPMKTGETPPGDDSSLEEHERFFGRHRRGRR